MWAEHWEFPAPVHLPGGGFLLGKEGEDLAHLPTRPGRCCCWLQGLWRQDTLQGPTLVQVPGSILSLPCHQPRLDSGGNRSPRPRLAFLFRISEAGQLFLQPDFVTSATGCALRSAYLHACSVSPFGVGDKGQPDPRPCPGHDARQVPLCPGP